MEEVQPTPPGSREDSNAEGIRLSSFFFLERSGELRIIILRRKGAVTPLKQLH